MISITRDVMLQWYAVVLCDVKYGVVRCWADQSGSGGGFVSFIHLFCFSLVFHWKSSLNIPPTTYTINYSNIYCHTDYNTHLNYWHILKWKWKDTNNTPHTWSDWRRRRRRQHTTEKGCFQFHPTLYIYYNMYATQLWWSDGLSVFSTD